MATYTYDCRISLFHLDSGGNQIFLNPYIETQVSLTEDWGPSIRLSVSRTDFAGAYPSVPSGISTMHVIMRIPLYGTTSRWSYTGDFAVSNCKAAQASTSGQPYSYREVYANVTTSFNVTGYNRIVNNVRYCFLEFDLPAISSYYNTDAGYRTFQLSAVVSGTIERLFTPGRVEFYNGRAFVYFRHFSTDYKWEMVNCNGVWFPLRQAYTGNGYIEKMMVYGFWAWLYVTGLGKYRVKLANYQFGRF